MSEERIFDTGQRIAKIRGGLTQAEFAERMGVDRKTVVRWEAGERLPDGASLLKLVQVFSADINYILTGQRDPARPVMRADDRALLNDFHASPKSVQDGVRATLGVFSPPVARPATGRKKAAGSGGQ